MNYKRKYSHILKEAKALLDPKADDIANMANLTALLASHFKFHWIGFYRVVKDQLILGPFQGPVACTRIAYGKGVCGDSWKYARSIVVDNVGEYPGHIACSPYSRSEIVVPLIRNNKVLAVLDIDSDSLAEFDENDREHLEVLLALL